jgi:Ca-activated chloride channel family protein
MLRAHLAWFGACGLAVLALGCGAEGDSGGASWGPSYRSGKTAQSAPAASSADSAESPAFSAPPAEAFSVSPGTAAPPPVAAPGSGPGQQGDRFAYQVENDFQATTDKPLSTFSIDVDTASYSKVRQYVMQQNSLPPADAVRIDEFVNYFRYDYAPPTDGRPIAIHAESTSCPWRPEHRLVRIGIRGRDLGTDRPACNLVFLVDVSGSMDEPNRLPLVKRGLEMIIDRLDERDRVAIVYYASSAGIALRSTPASEKQTIRGALNQLHAGGSTNGGDGISLAYRLALENFREGGVNRVLLCTDGDFNVGVTSPGDLVRLAAQHARQNVFLTVLGFGIGNHNDALLEQISNQANGNYAFIDNWSEARKVLVRQISGTLVAIAKDVKVQVEFNPARASAYRLIGYEDRQLADRDFNDDRKDAGDMGAGHCVTALYEVVPADDASEARPNIDPLKYQANLDGFEKEPWKPESREMLTVKVRYKHPEGNRSDKLSLALADEGKSFENASPDFRFAAAVAAFGMRLRNSPYLKGMNYHDILQIAEEARGRDGQGDQADFAELVARTSELSGGGLAWNNGTSASAPFFYRPQVRPYVAANQYHWPSPGMDWWPIVIGAVGIVFGIACVALAIALVLVIHAVRVPHGK